MKRYKLKKDTPAFKAGTECYIEEAGHMVPCRGISYTIVHKDQLEKNPNILTDWFEEIEEPLIKDEKIRKAVRAWAEANEVLEVFIDCIGDGTYIELYDEDDGRRRISALRPAGVKTGEAYTIDELCGEEEG